MDKRLREDFPIDWREDQYVSRREFFKFVTLASGGMAVASVGLAAWAQIPRGSRKFEPLLIAASGSLQVGAWLPFNYPRSEDACMLIRVDAETFKAFSRRCTHLSCPVVWQADANRLYCPCHNGAFSPKDGHVLQGPPARPLPEIELSIQGEQVFAIGVKDGTT